MRGPHFLHSPLAILQSQALPSKNEKQSIKALKTLKMLNTVKSKVAFIVKSKK